MYRNYEQYFCVTIKGSQKFAVMISEKYQVICVQQLPCDTFEHPILFIILSRGT